MRVLQAVKGRFLAFFTFFKYMILLVQHRPKIYSFWSNFFQACRGGVVDVHTHIFEQNGFFRPYSGSVQSWFFEQFFLINVFLKRTFLGNSMELNTQNVFLFYLDHNCGRNTRNKNPIFWFLGFLMDFLRFLRNSDFRFGISIKF